MTLKKSGDSCAEQDNSAGDYKRKKSTRATYIEVGPYAFVLTPEGNLPRITQSQNLENIVEEVVDKSEEMDNYNNIKVSEPAANPPNKIISYINNTARKIYSFISH